jgi:hypothetical protein
LKALQDRVLDTANKSGLSAKYLRKFRSEFSDALNSLIASRKVDPKEVKKQKLQEKLAQIQSQIAGLK